MRRSERIRRKNKPIKPVKKKVEAPVKVKKADSQSWYNIHYKKLLLIPLILLIASIAAIGIQVAQTGDFIHRGVGLKGGVLISAPTETIQPYDLELALQNAFPEQDIEVRALEQAGEQIAVTITADIDTTDEATFNKFISAVQQVTKASTDDLSIETIGSSLGATFFEQTLKALFIAFIFMGFVVFLYFGKETSIKIYTGIASIVAGSFMYSGILALNIIALVLGIGLIVVYGRYSVPSVAVILAALSDIIITLAIVNLLGIKLTTAGIAAFLMLIGYSVDTDILLSTRVVKRKGGTVYDRVIGALKTGLTMNATTFVAITIALVLAQSDVLIQIMSILLIGLVVDMINTWFQNVGILRWYLEKEEDA